MDWPADQLDDLAANPQLLAELQAARAAGVSWRRWCGWEPARTTTFRYDGGRLVEAVTVTEAEWDDEQRAAVYALMEYEAGLCPGCHRPVVETTDPEREDGYVVGLPVRCHRCTALHRQQGVYRDQEQPDALLFQVSEREAPDGRR